MARWLKEGIDPDIKQKADAAVRKTVEDILESIDERGDAAVRELSEKFDAWGPESFQLTRDQIEACYDALDEQAINDIRFAQE
ncbi:MAG: histidinol dehydrogenase, partial [Pseudomonadota bacterium]